MLILVLSYLILLLIDKKLKYVINFLLKIILCYNFALRDIKFNKHVINLLKIFYQNFSQTGLLQMIQKLYTVLFDGGVLFSDKYSGNVTFTTDVMDILYVNLNNINLNDAKFYVDDPKTITDVTTLGLAK